MPKQEVKMCPMMFGAPEMWGAMPGEEPPFATEPDTFPLCLREKCEWWDGNLRCCSTRAVSRWLREIDAGVERIVMGV